MKPTMILAVAATFGVSTTEALVISKPSSSSSSSSSPSFRVSHTTLSAVPSCGGGTSGGANGGSSSSATSSTSSWGGTRSRQPQPFAVPSKTARESAVNVEWEPMTELERRIEDGVHYEHIPNHYSNNKIGTVGYIASRRYANNDDDGTASTEATTSTSKAVFCGYRYSDDDYNRLKSAEIVE